MSREIKFRAWDKSRSKFSNTGNLQLEIGGYSGLFWQFGLSTKPLSKEESDKFILMQFTGLKDKNGKEIYEGDIIEYYRLKTGTEQFYPDRTKRKAVVWEEYNRCIGYNLRPVIKKEGGYWEVIGNIWENPELLRSLSHV